MRQTPLSDYLKKTGITQVELAKTIGVAQGQVSDWASGVRRPGLDHALRLEEATRGAVPAKSWSKRRRRSR